MQISSQILEAVIVFFFSVALALKKADFVSRNIDFNSIQFNSIWPQINQSFAVLPGLHLVLFLYPPL